MGKNYKTEVRKAAETAMLKEQHEFLSELSRKQEAGCSQEEINAFINKKISEVENELLGLQKKERNLDISIFPTAGNVIFQDEKIALKVITENEKIHILNFQRV